MATVATLVVEMQANTAEFVKTWDKTGKKVREGRDALTEAQKAAIGFAKSGLGEITAGVPGAARAIDVLAKAAFSARGGMLAMGGQFAIIVAGTLAVAAAVQKLREVVREKVWGLDSDNEARQERMQQEIEAERKWLEERKASVNLIRDMERSRAQALTEAAAARAQADGDELAAAQATLNGRIQVIEQEKAARVAAAIQATAQTKDTILREQMITAATREENAKKEAAEAQFQAKRAEIQAAALTKALENIKKEADANQAAIDKIVAARQAMSTAGSAAAQALNISGITNVDKVRTFGQNLEAVAKKFHMLREEGVPYRDLSTAIDTATGELTTEFQKLRAEVGEDAAAADLLDRTWRQFDFGNLRTNIENQRQAFEDQGISLMQINTLIGQQRDLLQVELPDAARRAGASIDDLNGRVRRLEDSFNAANKEMREFDRLAAQAQQ